MSAYILVIDEGTTSTRAIAFDRKLTPLHSAQEEIALSFPNDGWVEQDPRELWEKTLAVCRSVIGQCGGVEHIAAIGMTNQRETTILWDRETGDPYGPAIVWQDRRTAARCTKLVRDGKEPFLQKKTGLLADPYFSGTKLEWMLNESVVAKEDAQSGRAAFGTVDSFLIWKLTGGKVHATDVTNASRTLLMDLATLDWDPELLELLSVPAGVLPDIRSSADDFGKTSKELFGKAIPIYSVAGDQQAALVGQGCLSPGEAKITYGTGAFLVANTGSEVPSSSHRLLATSGYRTETTTAYALEGSIFNAGTVVKWLRDELGLISSAGDSSELAAGLSDNGGVYFVPAFTGLGAPHWDPDARGEITGLSRGTRAAHIVRAGLEAAVYQTLDLLDAFAADGVQVKTLRVDGGMAVNDWLMQFLADITQCTVERPPYSEMTAFGAAVLAADQLGWLKLEDWQAKRVTERVFQPQISLALRESLIDGWQRAIDKTLKR